MPLNTLRYLRLLYCCVCNRRGDTLRKSNVTTMVIKEGTNPKKIESHFNLKINVVGKLICQKHLLEMKRHPNGKNTRFKLTLFSILILKILFILL